MKKTRETTHLELHVACSGSLGAGGRDLLRQIGGWHDHFREGDAIVLEEDDLQLVADVRVVVHLVGDVVEQLDDLLGHVVPGGGLAADHDRPGHDGLVLRVGLDAVVQRHDVKDVQQLTLVLVDPLYLDVEERSRIHLDSGLLCQIVGKLALVLSLDL